MNGPKYYRFSATRCHMDGTESSEPWKLEFAPDETQHLKLHLYIPHPDEGEDGISFEMSLPEEEDYDLSLDLLNEMFATFKKYGDGLAAELYVLNLALSSIVPIRLETLEEWHKEQLRLMLDEEPTGLAGNPIYEGVINDQGEITLAMLLDNDCQLRLPLPTGDNAKERIEKLLDQVIALAPFERTKKGQKN